MRRHWVVTALLPTAFLIGACAAPAPARQADGQVGDLNARAATLFQAYARAITTPHRDSIAGFYHPEGALRVINGLPRRLSRAALDSSYRGPWSPPAFFAFDSLAFDSIAPGQVIVTGEFRWQSAGQPDTARYLYAALLQTVGSELFIRFEHETESRRR